jgi:DDE family transposase
MKPPTSPDPKPQKRSSVRHTRAIQRDRSKRPTVAPPDEQMAQHLTELIHPATLAQLAHFHDLGLRARLLSLPVMVALVLSMLWRQIGSVHELVRVLQREGFLWTSPVQVSQQALSQRLLTFPAALFQRVLLELVPRLQARFAGRTRPLPPVIAWAQKQYTALLVVDGSSLDALLRKVGLLREAEKNPLAGKMTALLDLASRLPRQLWFEPDPQAHDQRAWPQILAALPPGALLLFDRGYTDFGRFLALTLAQVTWITRAKNGLVFQLERTLTDTAQIQESLGWIGRGETRQQVRQVAALVGGKWYRYLTNERDPTRLPAPEVVALYRHRWQIEEAYATVKRLLGLAFFWVGSENGVQLQLWATWLLYAVLVDLTDAVAEELQQPVTALSLEMVYRSVYHFTQAFHRGAASDPVVYLAEDARGLGILKQKRKPPMLDWPALSVAASP